MNQVLGAGYVPFYLIITTEELAAELKMPVAYPEIGNQELDKLATSIQDCFHQQGSCLPCNSSIPLLDIIPNTSFLPRRAIDVGKMEGGSTVYLHEFLKSERAHYVTLSYRWGKVSPFKSTSETFQAYQFGIDFKSLPQLFQDAVIITRSLGVRYLWIDAICIIQDDQTDWLEQAPFMGKIYQNAYCTIAAHSVEHPEIGLLKQNESMNTISIPLNKISRGTTKGTLCIGATRSFRQAIEQSVIVPRAWVLQELALSQRTAHISDGNIYWDCPHRSYPHALGLGIQESTQRSLALKMGQDFTAFDSWLDIVSEYSRCQLTFETDKLFAIAGIAAEWQRRMVGSVSNEYYFGLFKCGLPQGLLWYTRKSSLQKIVKRAPSWSWPSVDGPIQFIQVRDALNIAEVLTPTGNYTVENCTRKTSPDCELTLCSVAKVAFVTPLQVVFGTHLAATFLRKTGSMIQGYHLFENMDFLHLPQTAKEKLQDKPPRVQRLQDVNPNVVNICSIGQASIDVPKLISSGKSGTKLTCVRVCVLEYVFLGVTTTFNVVLLVVPSNKGSKKYTRVGVGIINKPGWFNSDPCNVTIE